MNTVGFVRHCLHLHVHCAELEECALLEVFRLLRQPELDFRVAQLQANMNVNECTTTPATMAYCIRDRP